MKEIAPSVGACVVCLPPLGGLRACPASPAPPCRRWRSGRPEPRRARPRRPPGRPGRRRPTCRPRPGSRVLQLLAPDARGAVRAASSVSLASAACALSDVVDEALDVVHEVLDALRLERALPGRDPPGRHRCPGSAEGDDLGQLRASSSAAARTGGSAPPTTPARQAVGRRLRRSAAAFGSQRGSSLLTTKVAAPPPPSTPWQFAHSSDLVLSYSFDCRVGEQRRAALDRLLVEAAWPRPSRGTAPR